MSEHLAAVPLPWAADAACRGRADDQVPASVCVACVVRLACLEEAYTHQVPSGTWGGYPPAARVELFAGAPDFREVTLRDHQRHNLLVAQATTNTVHPTATTPPGQLALFG